MPNNLGLVSTLFLVALIAGQLVRAGNSHQDQPAVIKSSVQVTARTLNFHGKNRNMWSWVPFFRFTLTRDRNSGDVHYVEYTIPGSGSLRFDCEVTGYGLECGGRAIPEDKGSIYTGSVPFAIKVRNELQGTDATLFTGKMKVAKACTNPSCLPTAGEWVYYVDHDWNLPIGYIWYTPNSVYEWDWPQFNAAFWARGNTDKIEPHLFYQGKEIGLRDGEPDATCSVRVENMPTHTPHEMVGRAQWSRVDCSFGIYRWDKTNNGRGQPHTNELFKMARTPAITRSRFCGTTSWRARSSSRSAPTGRLTTVWQSANKLNTPRVIVPVTIIGDQDGQWDRTAWKTEAFYGNPLTGFTSPQ